MSKGFFYGVKVNKAEHCMHIEDLCMSVVLTYFLIIKQLRKSDNMQGLLSKGVTCLTLLQRP